MSGWTFKSSYEFEEQTATSTQMVFSFELEERKLFMRPFKNLIRTMVQEGAQRTSRYNSQENCYFVKDA
jgi:hypothetical protein